MISGIYWDLQREKKPGTVYGLNKMEMMVSSDLLYVGIELHLIIIKKGKKDY